MKKFTSLEYSEARVVRKGPVFAESWINWVTGAKTLCEVRTHLGQHGPTRHWANTCILAACQGPCHRPSSYLILVTQVVRPRTYLSPIPRTLPAPISCTQHPQVYHTYCTIFVVTVAQCLTSTQRSNYLKSSKFPLSTVVLKLLVADFSQ
jgi:hypothetical protein